MARLHWEGPGTVACPCERIAQRCPDGPLWRQVTRGVTCGGLGLRTALGVTLPAFVASRIMCRPLVSTIVDHFSIAFGVPSQSIMAEYDARTDAALARLVATLPTRHSSCWASSTKPWLNVSFPGATSSLESRTPCRTCPRHPSDTPLPTMVTETTSIWPGNA